MGEIVPRAELFARLSEAGRVTVVSAPGGSGKTSLVRSWIAAAGLTDSVGWVSVEREEWRNGAFTKAIIEGLVEGRADLLRKGTITLSQLDAYVVNRVKELTNGTQHPIMTRPPTVPDGTARIRIALTLNVSEQTAMEMIAALSTELSRLAA